MPVTLSDLSYELSDDRGTWFSGRTLQKHMIAASYEDRRAAPGQVLGGTDRELQTDIDAFLARTLLSQ